MSHELSKESDVDNYFAKEFAPAVPMVVLGRSYKSEPECKPEETLFDNWMEISRMRRQSTVASWERGLQIDVQFSVGGGPILGWLTFVSAH